MKKIPVILDTDIGTDIDDTWALAFLLKCPEIDLKLVLTDTGDTEYRAKLAAKLLQLANRTDIPVGIGLPFTDKQKFMEEWVKNYKLADYPGKIFRDGIKAFINIIENSCNKITLICISSMPNIAMAIEKKTHLVDKIRFIGMHGSIYKGYNGINKPSAESNVKYHNEACKKVFSMLKDISIIPLDTCGIVRLDGELYKKVLCSSDPVNKALIKNYLIWHKNVTWHVNYNPEKNTSVLFDTVPVYAAYERKLLKFKKIKIKITSDGMTVPDKNGYSVNAALEWKDINKFKEILVNRLTG